MAKTFFFYDLETFGLNPQYDRIVQFAGIRTDENFQIIGKKIVLYCKLTPDYLPSPYSCLVHGITPQVSMDEGLTEYEFAKRIYEEMMQPGTISLGYNSLKFDDEFIRALFYRNFFDPYAREYQQGNSRWDIIDLVRACHDLRPDGIVWPREKSEDGKAIFKLEALSKANGVDTGLAHDALNDVEATIGIAKLVQKKQPKLFEWYFEHRTRDSLRPLINLVERTPLVYTSSIYSAVEGCTTIIAPISLNPEDRNHLIAIDLRFDPKNILDRSVEELRSMTFSKRAERTADTPYLPLSRLRLNRCPFLAPLATLSKDAAKTLGIDIDACLRHHALITSHPDLLQKLSAVFEGPIDSTVNADPELRLYDGFFSPEDAQRFGEIHKSLSELPPAQAKAKLYRYEFDDDRPAQMLRRFFARNYASTLSPEEQKRWRNFCASRLQLPPVEGATDLADYQKIIMQKMEASNTAARDRAILHALLEYKANLEKEILGYVE